MALYERNESVCGSLSCFRVAVGLFVRACRVVCCGCGRLIFRSVIDIIEILGVRVERFYSGRRSIARFV